eukprot:GILJ01024085.1.p1 GENE.GILJ01024085.1~~GILJ01024085.1.p1  ORF type:complete len:313 (-),score=13.28 GILJ01024085.1:154-1092(-)
MPCVIVCLEISDWGSPDKYNELKERGTIQFPFPMHFVDHKPRPLGLLIRYPSHDESHHHRATNYDMVQNIIDANCERWFAEHRNLLAVYADFKVVGSDRDMTTKRTHLYGVVFVVPNKGCVPWGEQEFGQDPIFCQPGGTTVVYDVREGFVDRFPDTGDSFDDLDRRMWDRLQTTSRPPPRRLRYPPPPTPSPPALLSPTPSSIAAGVEVFKVGKQTGLTRGLVECRGGIRPWCEIGGVATSAAWTLVYFVFGNDATGMPNAFSAGEDTGARVWDASGQILGRITARIWGFSFVTAFIPNQHVESTSRCVLQ